MAHRICGEKGVGAPKRLSRPWEWTLDFFHKNCSSLYQSKDNLIFISKFNNHYLDLLKEVYNVSVPQGAQKIPAIKVRGVQKPSYLPYKTEVYLCPRDLTAGIFWNETGKNIALDGTKIIFLKSMPFHSNGLCTYCDPATPNFISSFNSHYSDLSKEVYNVFIS